MALALRRTGLIGRAGDLAQLADAVAARGERPGLLLVGEAGIGKTRLLREFARSVEDGGGLAITGGCFETGGELLPYAPFVDALDELRDRLGGDVFRGPGATELAPLVPALAGSRVPRPEPLRLFEAVRSLLDRTPDPTMLVLEDLQWADRSSLVLLSYLVRRTRRGRVLLVATARGDELAGDHPAALVMAELVRGGRARRIDLQPLPDADVRVLVDAVAPGLDGNAASQIVARSEGNPFFAEALASDPSGQLGSIPATLRDDLLARVQRAPAAVRTVMELVAIVGRPVAPPLLVASWPGASEELEEGLRVGLELGLLVNDATGSRVALRHSLIGQAIEDHMSPLDHARLHERLATLLGGRPELAALTEAGRTAELASHWRRAGRDAEALRASVLAGITADEVPARAEAWSHFEAAITLWDRVPAAEGIAGVSRARLLCRAARAASLTGKAQRAIELETLATEAAAADGAIAVGEHYATLAAYELEVRDIEGMAAHAREAIARIPASPPTRERGFALWAVARSIRHADSAGSLRLFREAIAVAESVSDRVLEARARSTYGIALSVLDHQEAAMAELDRAVTIADATRDPAAERAAHWNRLIALFWQRPGVAAAERAIEAYRRVASRLDINADDELALARIYLAELGDEWERAEALLTSSLETDARPPVSAALRLERGMIRALSGRFEEADHDLRTALDQQHDTPALVPLDLVAVEQALAEAALQRKAPAEALGHLDQALRAFMGHCYPVEILALSAFGLRAAADVAETARSRHDTAALEDALAQGGAHRLRLEAGLAGTLVAGMAADGPLVRAMCAWGLAEASRMEGVPDPALWAEAADRLAAWRYPQLEPYARFRRAEALLASDGPRADAATLLAEAYRRGCELRLAPLCADMEALARRARLRGVTAVMPAGQAREHGLSPRENEVLALLLDGRTNREIGELLFISEKTASVHVTHILNKLGVNSRGAAAAVAARRGLVTTAPQDRHAPDHARDLDTPNGARPRLDIGRIPR
jgi:predicted ATPase/DNA-binding CsgD family transcriptional regulator